MSAAHASRAETSAAAAASAWQREATNIAFSAAGPSAAAIFSNPADVAKTRLNMDRELQSSGKPPRYTGTFDCIRRVWAAEGMAGVQRGLSFAMVREASKCSFRIGLHEPIVEALHSGPGPASFSIKFIGGLASGGIAALICNPLDLIKRAARRQQSPSPAHITTSRAPSRTCARRHAPPHTRTRLQLEPGHARGSAASGAGSGPVAVIMQAVCIA
jgi:solute carrier family 25 protein 34/35